MQRAQRETLCAYVYNCVVVCIVVSEFLCLFAFVIVIVSVWVCQLTGKPPILSVPCP